LSDPRVQFKNQIKYKGNITLIEAIFPGGFRRERANYWRSAGYSLYLKANDENADFDNKGSLANANDNYSAGMVFFGLCLKNKDSIYLGSLLQFLKDRRN